MQCNFNNKINCNKKKEMSLKQALLSKFFERGTDRDSDSEAASDDESVYLPSKKRSMFNEPMSWTRVKELA